MGDTESLNQSAGDGKEADRTHILVHFESVWWCLIIRSWSSFYPLYAEKGCNGNPIFTFPPCLCISDDIH